MRNRILRVLINAALLALISGIVISITGLMLKWKTSTQFSDGFFWAGAILISLGFLNVLGGHNQATSRLMTSQSAVHLDTAERFRLWEADTLKGYNLLALLGTSGVLLFCLSGLAILVGL